MSITINITESVLVRTENVERFRIEMARYQPLSDEDTKKYITLAQKGNESARNKVINHNLRFVWSVAKKYAAMDTFEDVLQNGNYGLCMAVDTFDVSRETKFSTWAVEVIRKYINIGLTNESRTVRVRADHYKVGNITSSLDAPIGGEDSEDKERTLLDTFSSDLRADNYEHEDSIKHTLKVLLDGISERERVIVCALFGIGCKEESTYTLSLRYGLTEERIRQIKMGALEKMQKMV